MSLLRVLLGFADASDHVLEETAGNVLAGLYGTYADSYTAPPVPKTALQTALTNFTNAIAAQQQGGPAATASKNALRNILIGLQRQLALYVQTVVQAIPNPDQAQTTLLGSGFDAVSTNRTQHPLATPHIDGIDNTGTGSLTLRLKGRPQRAAPRGAEQERRGRLGERGHVPEHARHGRDGVDLGDDVHLPGSCGRRQHGAKRLERPGQSHELVKGWNAEAGCRPGLVRMLSLAGG